MSLQPPSDAIPTRKATPAPPPPLDTTTANRVKTQVNPDELKSALPPVTPRSSAAQDYDVSSDYFQLRGLDIYEEDELEGNGTPVTQTKDEDLIIHSVVIQSDGRPESKQRYVRLPPPVASFVFRVILPAGNPCTRAGVLHTNLPHARDEFQRDSYRQIPLDQNPTNETHVDLFIHQAGVFEYWIEYDSNRKVRCQAERSYFVVDPIIRLPLGKVLKIPEEGRILVGGDETDVSIIEDSSEISNTPLDALVVLTCVAKFMSHSPHPADWESTIVEAQNRGYNMIHYTPLQPSGQSNSPYSIVDQLSFAGGVKEEEMRQQMKKWRSELGVGSITDIVLNHTADNSAWLLGHEDSGYNSSNSPHLTPAIELDKALQAFSHKRNGLVVKDSSQLAALMSDVENEVLSKLSLWEYYVCDVEFEVKSFSDAYDTTVTKSSKLDIQSGSSLSEVVNSFKNTCITGLMSLSSRYSVKSTSPIDAVAFMKEVYPHESKETHVLEYTQILRCVNVPLYAQWDDDRSAILSNLSSRARFNRLDAHGPCLGPLSDVDPLFEQYFVPVKGCKVESRKYLAVNGWIWAADPLKNFAEPESKVYLRRELISWGDCVKLRFGRGPEDNPWLWEFFTQYSKLLARTFDGFRIDNCHSTPIHVAEFMLDAARRENPNLYVCAELFTGSEETDIVFVSRLGINSLIREVCHSERKSKNLAAHVLQAMNASSAAEQGSLMYRFGLNKPIGSMDAECLTKSVIVTHGNLKRSARVIPHAGSIPHALFTDCTHDNESPSQKRTTQDALSTGALNTFNYCAVASTKGYDDLYPKILNVVTEKRLYTKYNNSGKRPSDNGTSAVKKILNLLHRKFILDGYSEGHVQEDGNYITCHRVHPQSHRGFLLIAHTALYKGGADKGYVAPIKLSRTKGRFLLGAALVVDEPYQSHDDVLAGLPSKLRDVECPEMMQNEEELTILVPDNFPPGSVMLFETWIEGLDESLDALCTSGVNQAFSKCGEEELNLLLYRCAEEERDATGGKIGTYNIPNHGDLTYAGFQGFMHVLTPIIRWNDLGHPFCEHLRTGTWAFQYIIGRLNAQLNDFPALKSPIEWLQSRVAAVSEKAPSFLRPKYFALILNQAYHACRSKYISISSDFIKSGDEFVHNLAMTSVQMYSRVGSASLSPFSQVAVVAAGLPHFATSWARTWGRDAGISLRGLFIATGNFNAAREHILAFLSTIKHGLIPNLFDSLKTPRYNSRDSPWWFLQALQDYTIHCPEKEAILQRSVKRRFPKDDTWVPYDDPRAFSAESTAAEIVQEILQRHAEGISFREYNAGPAIDDQMTNNGFNIKIYTDWKTGFIMGGNPQNCGTWMDKMGSSSKSGNKGVPSTPRNGAPIEITGLLKSCLRWVNGLAKSGKWPSKGVNVVLDGNSKLITYEEWEQLIQNSFEKNYYVPAQSESDSLYNVNSKLINRRGIYKDVLGSDGDREWCDYQLRCNFPIAMTVAPELFDAEHARGALQLADEILVAPLGVRTLDPSDQNYRSTYDNSNDGTDPTVAAGANYHQGPEWGWPLGYFLRAWRHFDALRGDADGDRSAESLYFLASRLAASRSHIAQDAWHGLPELTNPGGAYCHDSCATQAWSSSCLLDVLFDVYNGGQ